MILEKVGKALTPAQAGVQNDLNSLDSRFRGNHENGTKSPSAAYIVSTPHSSGFGRLASGAFYLAIGLKTF
jgi:hypothetical protein